MDAHTIAERLTKAQRELLLSFAPTLDEQETTEDVVFNAKLAPRVEIRPPEYEGDIMVYPGDDLWLAATCACSPAGSSTWDKCTFRFNEIGLEVRNILLNGEGK